MGYSELEQARQAVAEERHRAELAARLATLEADAAQERRESDADARLSAARAQARQAVDTAGAELEAIGAEFIDWTQQAWRMARRLYEAEAPLYAALEALAVAAQNHAAAQIPRHDLERATLTPWRHIADAELRAIGADKLEALPAAPATDARAFIDELRTAILGHAGRVGRIWAPHLGAQQFERRR